MNFEILAPSSEQSVPLGAWLATHIPARVRRPGEIVGYSNHGTALAGYIVEIVAGMPFEQYIQENIFTPLGMTQSTAYQPVPAALAQDLVQGYSYADGAYQVQAFEHFLISPAGAFSVSGIDMAKLLDQADVFCYQVAGSLDGEDRFLKRHASLNGSKKDPRKIQHIVVNSLRGMAGFLGNLGCDFAFQIGLAANDAFMRDRPSHVMDITPTRYNFSSLSFILSDDFCDPTIAALEKQAQPRAAHRSPTAWICRQGTEKETRFSSCGKPSFSLAHLHTC